MLHRDLTIICLTWSNQRTNRLRVFFLKIRFITITYPIDNFQTDSYKRRARVIVWINRMFFSQWWRLKSHSAMKIAKHQSIKETPVFSRPSIIWTKINARPSFAPQTKNLFGVSANVFLIHSKGTFRLNDPKKNRLSKYKIPLRRITTKRGKRKDKRKLLVQRGGFFYYTHRIYIIDLIISNYRWNEILDKKAMEGAKKMILISTENVERMQVG